MVDITEQHGCYHNSVWQNIHIFFQPKRLQYLPWPSCPHDAHSSWFCWVHCGWWLNRLQEYQGLWNMDITHKCKSVWKLREILLQSKKKTETIWNKIFYDNTNHACVEKVTRLDKTNVTKDETDARSNFTIGIKTTSNLILENFSKYFQQMGFKICPMPLCFQPIQIDQRSWQLHRQYILALFGWSSMCGEISFHR